MKAKQAIKPHCDRLLQNGSLQEPPETSFLAGLGRLRVWYLFPFLVYLLSFNFLSSCGSPHLERSGVPVWAGLRLDTLAGFREPEASLDSLIGWDYAGLQIEIPVRNGRDSLALPFIHSRDLVVARALIDKARKFNFPIAITLNSLNNRELYPPGRLVSAETWFNQLSSYLEMILSDCHACPVRHLIIGENWRDSESFQEEWRNFLTSTRKRYDLPAAYGCSIDRLDKISFLDANGELAVSYPAADPNELKGLCREWNHLASEKAQSLGKSVFIFRSNLIGEDAAWQFQNQLRFWQPEVKLEGMVLNSIYPSIPMLDSTTYYGLAENRSFFEFFESWRKRTTPSQ